MTAEDVRTLAAWILGLGAILGLVALFAAGLTFSSLGRYQDDRE